MDILDKYNIPLALLCHLKLRASQWFSQRLDRDNIKQMSKFCITCLLWGEYAGMFPLERVRNAERRFHVMTSARFNELCTVSVRTTVYPKKYAHGFVVLCFVVVMQSFIMNSHEVFIHIHQGCFAGTGSIVRLPQCQWSKPDGYGKISQCITTTKHSKARTVCIFIGIYCT